MTEPHPTRAPYPDRGGARFPSTPPAPAPSLPAPPESRPSEPAPPAVADGEPVGRLAVVACKVLEAEIRHFAAGIQPAPLLRFLEQDLHDQPDELRKAVQAAVTEIETGAPDPTDADTMQAAANADPGDDAPAIHAIALGYGLCSRGLEGVVARRARLILPRAHDCITLFLGDRKRYATYVADHPGTYWYTPGWIATESMPGRERYERALAHYRAEYDEDDAEYLMETMEGWVREYNNAVYVDLGVGDGEASRAYTQTCAEWLGWNYEDLAGDASLLRALLHGPWDERFAHLEPGQTVKFNPDEHILDILPA